MFMQEVSESDGDSIFALRNSLQCCLPRTSAQGIILALAHARSLGRAGLSSGLAECANTLAACLE